MQQSGHVAYRIGVSYKMGYGVPEDSEKSEKYFAIALRLLKKSDSDFKALTDPQILFDLGVMFSSGYGCEKDTPIAFTYFERGAAQGIFFSSLSIGLSIRPRTLALQFRRYVLFRQRLREKRYEGY
jgi:TPR repeat protein